MSKTYESVFETDTLSLSVGKDGFWLYDTTRGMNLAMRANTEREALIEALEYYQERLIVVEKDCKETKSKVIEFIGKFVEDFDEYDL